MSLPFTSVVSYHQSEYGCGVAKFSKQLARRLSIPFAGFNDVWGEHPLLSLKLSEIDIPSSVSSTIHWHRDCGGVNDYSLFWHDAGDPEISDAAACVYYADPSLGPNGLWCPSLLPKAPSRPLRLFSFGMAHKIQIRHFERMKLLLDRDGIVFHLRVSVGLHEGSSLADASAYFDVLKQTLGPERVTILGILSDEAVAVELREADYVLSFFDTGLRANNTTVHAALEAHKPVITNHDAQTPGYMKAATRDILTMSGLETHIPYHYSWDRLLDSMKGLYRATAYHRQSSHQRQ